MSRPPMQIGWKVSSLKTDIASVRYRALLPMLALQSDQVTCKLFSSGHPSNLAGIDALVIVKSFTPEDLTLAQHAASKGIRVLFDLCDNIFIDALNNRTGKSSPAQIFDAIAAVVDCVVVTTEPLAEVVRKRLPHMQVTVIPDGIETPVLLNAMGKLCADAKAWERTHRWRALISKLSRLAVRLTEEGPGLLIKLFRRFIDRGPKEIRRIFNRSRKRSVKKEETVFRAIEAPEAQIVSRHAKIILWFGNHGAAHARFGMLDLLEVREALEAAAISFDVELVVISNHRSKYEDHIRPMNIPTQYHEWSPRVVNQWLAVADVVVVPNSLDPFSLCKSANRTVLAVSKGVPVVATPTPALVALSPHIHTGDTFSGLQRYLSDREAGRRDALAAYALAQNAFGQEAIAKMWQIVLSQPRSAQLSEVPAQCIVALNLIQDLDLAVPVIDAWTQSGVPVQAWCSAALIRKSPRVLATLGMHRIAYRVLPDDLPTGSFGFSPDTKALLTVTETNLGPHRFTRKLSELALAQGLAVATMQHGFENVGLTYEDAVHSIDRVTIKAQRIYIWGGLETLHPRLDATVRARCISVGCPKPAITDSADLGNLLTKGQPVIGIFENLHWHRYDDTYRQAFLDAVGQLAENFPQVTFLVKPHHAGLWLTHRYAGQRPASSNLVIADPQTAPWENHTASALLGIMTAVITTPSTVALDAARYSLPVAVFAGGLDLSNYQPLPLLQSLTDWQLFVHSALDLEPRGKLKEASASFVARVLVNGDGAQRIAMDLITATKE